VTLQIFILGTLSEGDRHPYDIKKQVVRPLDESLTINDGTLYYHFDSMEKKGLIRKIEVVHSENRPDKTMYAITDEGRAALEEGIYAAFQKMTSMTSLYSSLPFLGKVDNKKLAYLVEEAIGKFSKIVDRAAQANERIGEVPEEKREALLFIAGHARERIESDIKWLRVLLDTLR